MPRFTLLACLLLMAAAAPAAATNYASPTGTGTTCSQAIPCFPTVATATAVAGEEVILAPGNYPAVGQLAVSAANVDVHGPATGARAVIQSTQSGGNASFYLDGVGDHLHDLDIVHQGTSARGVSLGAAGVVVERVSVSSSQTGSFCFSADTDAGQVVRDSVCNVTGTSSEGVHGFDNDHLLVAGVTLRVPNGDAADIRSINKDTTATFVDTILLGSAGHDLDLSFGSLTNTVNVAVSYSDYDQTNTCASGCTISAGTGNITAAPLFVSASDLRQAAGSPTIDKGIAHAQLGATDLEGDPRAMGAAPDVGADEWRVSPSVGGAAATAVGADTATIGAPVDALGTTATAHIEYGLTTAYGAATAETPVPAGAGPQAVSALLSGLSPGTTYHARVVSSGQFGTPVAGADVAFTTTVPGAPAGPGGAGATGDVTAPVLSSLKLLRKRLRLTLSESATVTVVLQRGKRTIRTRARKLAGGRRSIAFKRAGLRRGRYRILVRAVDDAGNRSKTATLHFRVRRR